MSVSGRQRSVWSDRDFWRCPVAGCRDARKLVDAIARSPHGEGALSRFGRERARASIGVAGDRGDGHALHAAVTSGCRTSRISPVRVCRASTDASLGASQAGVPETIDQVSRRLRLSMGAQLGDGSFVRRSFCRSYWRPPARSRSVRRLMRYPSLVTDHTSVGPNAKLFALTIRKSG